MNDKKIKDLQGLFISRGYNPVIGTIYQKQEYWLSWYRGDVDGIHTMQKKNAEGTLIAITKPSLQMAKKVAEDLTSLLFNENVTLSVNDKSAQTILDEVLDRNNFYDEMPNFVELTAGPYGTGVMIEYIADDMTMVNYLFGDKVYVIDYNNTTAKGVAVVQEFQKDKMKYTHIMYLTMVEGKYRIQHEMYSTKEGNKGIGHPASLSALFSEKEMNKMKHNTEVDGDIVVEYYTEYDTDTPHFQVFKLAIANNYDVKSPLGISQYANAISTLENIDEKYYSSRMESINKRVRLFIDDEASKLQKYKNPTTNQIEYKKYFDPDETQFQTLKGMTADGQKAIEIFAPTYEIEKHDKGIQAELNYLSLKCLGSTDYYNFEGGAVGYQNELNTISSNSDLYRFRQKHLNKLEQVLVGMMKSILFLENDLGNYTGKLDLEYTVQFDDDLMTDDATKLAQLRLDAYDGYAPEYMYVMAAYKIDKTAALKQLAEAGSDYKEPEPVTPIVPPVDQDDEDEIDEDEE